MSNIIKRFGKRWGGAGIKSDISDKSPWLHWTKAILLLLSFCKKKVSKEKHSLFIYFSSALPDVVTAPAAPLTVVARRAYPSPLNAARPSTDSLRSPTPGRLASVNLAARQFLAIAYFASLVTASDLAALTELYLLRENLYLFPLSDFAGQKTKVI